MISQGAPLSVGKTEGLLLIHKGADKNKNFCRLQKQENKGGGGGWRVAAPELTEMTTAMLLRSQWEHMTLMSTRTSHVKHELSRRTTPVFPVSTSGILGALSIEIPARGVRVFVIVYYYYYYVLVIIKWKPTFTKCSYLTSCTRSNDSPPPPPSPHPFCFVTDAGSDRSRDTEGGAQPVELLLPIIDASPSVKEKHSGRAVVRR